MTKSAMVVTGVVLIVAGAALALFLVTKGLIPGFHPYQVPGDPPVTVGDGSLHAHSQNGWVPDTDAGKTIVPNPKSGTGGLHNDCPDLGGRSAIIWTDDDQTYDISPGSGMDLIVNIQHDSDDVSAGGDPSVIITVPSIGYPLTIVAKDGKFEDAKPGKKKGAGNRQHSRPGEVESIQVTGSKKAFKPWMPKSNHPHYTVGFCYY